MSEKRNPHMSLTALDPPRSHPPRMWQCDYCGARGLYDDLLRTQCTHKYLPCKTCGQAPECAPDCAAVARALAGAGIVTAKFPPNRGN